MTELVGKFITKTESAVHSLNDFFFDVEEGEPADVVSALLFYGVCLLGVGISVCIAIVVTVG